MKFLKSIFSKNTYGHMKLQFSKSDRSWHVMDGYDVVYIGEKDKCLRYIHHMVMMAKS